MIKYPNLKEVTLLALALVIAVFIGVYLYNDQHFFILYLTIAGILAGFVNFFYIFLNLPFQPVAESGDKPKGLLNLADSPWEQPRKTYWLALSGYLIIGLAGSYLTPLLKDIVDLKGDLEKNHWILLGYGIVFGFGANRLLSNVLASVLTRINSLKPAMPPAPPATSTNLLPGSRMNLFRLKSSDIPNDFDQLTNVPDMSTNFIRGIDISHHNGQISDWGSLKDKGINFAYLKVSEGVGSPDKMAQINAALAINNGLNIGYYHFGRPDQRNGGTVVSDATAEAIEFFNLMKNLPPSQLPFMLDLEDVQTPFWDSPLNQVDYLNWVNTFFAALTSLLQNNTQEKLLIYSRKSYLDNKLPDGHGLETNFDLWLSRYIGDYNKTAPVKGWTNWKIWQFTGDSAIIGTNPNPFDLDLIRVV